MHLQLRAEGRYFDLFHITLPSESLDVVRNLREEIENEPAPPQNAGHLLLIETYILYRKEEEEVIPEGIRFV